MTSWKTTVAGTMTSAGLALMGAGQFDWMTPVERHNALMLGFILSVTGPVVHGLVGRDNDKSDQDVKLRPERSVNPNPTHLKQTPLD